MHPPPHSFQPVPQHEHIPPGSRKIHLWKLEAKDDLPQPGQVLPGRSSEGEEAAGCPCLSKLGGARTGGHRSCTRRTLQARKLSTVGLNDGTWLL